MKKSSLIFSLFSLLAVVISCSDDDGPLPGGGEDEEVISQVILTFTPDGDGDVVSATWLDADGEGAGAPVIDDLELIEGTEYVLTMTLANTLGEEEEDITAEINAEADEHMFFFEFTEGIFGDPTGDGNVDNRADPVNYNDEDENGFPVGLSTTWTAGAHTESAGEFTIVLKHQPDLKTATSDSETGGTDLDITFPLSIEEDPNEEEEVINQIVLTFAPVGGGDNITATWFDADGEGVGNPTIDDISLAPNTEYNMTMTLANTLGMEVEDVTVEINNEADEHMFFFEFTSDIFSDPAGDGNVNGRADPLNYSDEDANGNPIGLSTNWTTGAATSSAATFGIILKHQPGGLKTTTSESSVGGTDVDIEFSLTIQ